MFNKLTLKNNDEPFTIKFCGVEHKVPHGLFEAEETLGNFIRTSALKWHVNLDVVSRPEAPTVKEIKEDSIKVIKEELDEDIKNAEEIKLTDKEKKLNPANTTYEAVLADKVKKATK